MTRRHSGIKQQALRWKPASRYLKHDIPPRLRDWLFDPSSLTKRLQHLCGAHEFRVQVISQRRDKITRHEANNLGLAARRQALVRQVYLWCGESAVVFARTIIPLSSLKGRQRRLAHLGQRSLGALLFADKTMSRGELQITRLDLPVVKDTADDRWLAADEKVWGRRSTFTVRGHQLLVSEFFLPALWPLRGHSVDNNLVDKTRHKSNVERSN